MKIIYQNHAGGVSVVHPTGELPIEQVALKDVPAGVPYRIVRDDEVPAMREERETWRPDFSAPDGYGLGAEEWFRRQSKPTAE